MKLKIILIITLLFSNLITAYLWLNDKDEVAFINVLLEGESEHWTIEDYHVIYSPDLMSKGDGTLTYKNEEKMYGY
ncbi:hypothetical protein [Pseudalkalibacillus berkeleyi]|uniref:Uncharacterized protein n=1 Tax=Pseudalkalibacillus berkeleyi TaxID=1069813 RepID=A0ABS9H4J2_9BACL|nr:hypothetical protein [Pseudalkalibacillus berkeleyi]MCF6138813.1 hypothetical protein [Pseudalkalibacillus berkeleyi]